MTDEILENHIEKYGDELGPTLYHLRNAWCDLWFTYNQYENLFGVNEERVRLLNTAGGSFFFNVERLFWRSCIMGVCRLTDPASTGAGSRKKVNMSLYQLPPLIEKEKLKAKICELINTAKSKSSYHREQRNKVISHSDFSVTNDKANLKSSGSRKNMKEVILSLVLPIVEIYAELGDSQFIPEVISSIPNETSLLYNLYAGVTEKKNIDKRRMDKGLSTGEWENYYPEWLQDREVFTHWSREFMKTYQGKI